MCVAESKRCKTFLKIIIYEELLEIFNPSTFYWL